MFEWLTNSKNLGGLGTFMGGAGSIYSGIMQQRAAKKMIDLEKQKFDFNKAQTLKDEEDMLKSRDAVSTAFAQPLMKF